MKILSALRNPAIFKLWLSQVFSSIGDNFYDMAVVWIATREVGASAGLIVLAGSLATLIFGLPGGVLVDRWNRRLTMVLVDATRMSVLLGLVFITFVGEIALWHLAVVTAINMGLNALFQPALIASVRIVSETSEEQQAVNALLDVTARLARAIAPSLAGFLLATVAPRSLFALDALTFAISALAIFSLNRQFNWQPKPQGASQKRLRDDILMGARLFLEHPVMRWLFPMKVALNFVWGFAFVIGIPLLVTANFGGDPRFYGYLVAAYGVGNVISNLIIGNLTIRRRAFVMFSGMIVFGVGFVLMGLAPTIFIAILGSFIASFGGPMDDIMLLLYVQDDFHEHHIGKVYSFRIVISEIGYALGVGTAAILYQFIPISTGIALGGLVAICCGIIGIQHFGLTLYERYLPSEPEA